MALNSGAPCPIGPISDGARRDSRLEIGRPRPALALPTPKDLDECTAELMLAGFIRAERENLFAVADSSPRMGDSVEMPELLEGACRINSSHQCALWGSPDRKYPALGVSNRDARPPGMGRHLHLSIRSPPSTAD
jgi:hypothetical protein